MKLLALLLLVVVVVALMKLEMLPKVVDVLVVVLMN